jgi:ubiquinone biosynthesis protein
MEHLDGILISKTAKLRNHASDIDEFARRGATMYLEMVFRDGFFHADPHPGNLMLLEGDIVGVLDCGMVQRLDEGLREKLVDVLMAVSQGDAEALAETVWALAAIPPTGSKQQLCADCAELLAEYASLPIKEIRLTQPLKRFTEIVRTNEIFLPPNISLLLRTLVELEGTAQLLNPRFSLLDLIEPYCQKALARRFSPRQISLRLRRDAYAWYQLMRHLPHDLKDMLDQIRVGTMSVHLEHRRLDPVVNRLVLGLVASSLFLGSSLLWSMKAPPLIKGVSLFGAIGYLLSVVIGLKLYRNIRSSEDLRSNDR